MKGFSFCNESEYTETQMICKFDQVKAILLLAKVS